MLLIETVLVLLGVLIAFVYPSLGYRRFEKLELRFSNLSRRRALSVVVVGVTAFALRIALLPVEPIPQPGVPDEFGHLLAADTFAHARLTNPAHPMWIHFENLIVIQQPTYASKYPPAQGLVLALGRILFGHPFWGVCLSIGLMSAVICWMLQGWVPSEWALLGGFLAVIRLGTFSYWANSYWGGAVAATGGALVLGALPRIKVNQRPRDALVMGIGLAILANSRPYEGLVFSVPVIMSLLFWLTMGSRANLSVAVRRIAPSLLGCLVLTVVAMCYYCWRVTGNPFLTPYQVSQNAYYPTPVFVWQPLRSMPMYHHPAIRDSFEKWELPVYRMDREHPILTAGAKAIHFWLFFFGPTLTAPFIILLFILPYGFSFWDLSPDTRLLLTIASISFLAVLMPLRFNPGYAAPLAAVVYALLIKALRRVRLWKTRDKETGVALSRAVVLSSVILLIIRAAAGPLHIPVSGGARTWYSVDFQLTDRARVQSLLSQSDKRQLVIVRYPEIDPSSVTEWVFNEADIDHSKVVWARDMGEEKNVELIRYFKDHTIWLLEPDKVPPRLSAYLTPEISKNSSVDLPKISERQGRINQRRRTLSLFHVALVALGVRAALLPIEPIPKPLLTDEFSYLLLADTLARGLDADRHQSRSNEAEVR